MPETENASVRLHYQLSGNEASDVLVLGNSLGSNLHMWDKVLPRLEGNLRVVRFDTRGHGASGVPTGPYSIDDLGRDVLAVLDGLGIRQANFCGLSLGGLVGQWLGIHAPERVLRLVLANTAARIGTNELWDDRIATVKKHGMRGLAETTPARWFTASYREDHTAEMERIQQMIAATDPDGYAGCCGVLRDTDLTNQVAAISAPCLVITGKHDPATSALHGWALHQCLRNSKYLELDASHLSAWERAEEFGAAVVEFLDTSEVTHG